MRGDGVYLRELGGRQHAALVRVLEKVRAEHRARAVILSAACGRPLALAGEACGTDLDAFASLSASAAAASGRLAQMMGEPSASLCLQRGDRDLIFLEPAGDLVVAVVFDSASPQGLERLRARLRLRRALVEIAAVLDETVDDAALAGIGPQELDDLLDPAAEAAD